MPRESVFLKNFLVVIRQPRLGTPVYVIDDNVKINQWTVTCLGVKTGIALISSLFVLYTVHHTLVIEIFVR